jgi:putative membrane protein
MFWYDHDLGWGWWGRLLMTLAMLAFWGLLIWGVVALARGAGTRRQPDVPDPERVLADRFARGEIDEAEYRHRLEVLRSAHRAQRPAPRP